MQRPAARMGEPHGALVVHAGGEAAFVEHAVVPAAEEHEVREFRFAAIGPVDDAMRVAVPGRTAGKAVTLVAELQGAADGRRDRAGLAADAEDPAGVVPYLDLAAVAGDAPGRLRADGDVGVAEPGAMEGRAFGVRAGRRRRRSGACRRSRRNAVLAFLRDAVFGFGSRWRSRGHARAAIDARAARRLQVILVHVNQDLIAVAARRGIETGLECARRV